MAERAGVQECPSTGTDRFRTRKKSSESPGNRNRIIFWVVRMLVPIVLISSMEGCSCDDGPTEVGPFGTIRGQVSLEGEGVSGVFLYFTQNPSHPRVGFDPEAHTDGNGNYSRELPVGAWNLWLTGIGVPDVDCPGPEVATFHLEEDGEAVRNIECVRQRGELKGELTVDDGPVPGATVVVFDSEFMVEVDRSPTDASGHFSFELLPGSYLLATETAELGAVCPSVFETETEVVAKEEAIRDLPCISLSGNHTIGFNERSNTCGTPPVPYFETGLRVEHVPVGGRSILDLYLGDRPDDTRATAELDPQTGKYVGSSPSFDDGSGILLQEFWDFRASLSGGDSRILTLEGVIRVVANFPAGGGCEKIFDQSATKTGN